MSIKHLQATAVLAVAVLAGLLGVQSTWALWNATAPSGAGTVYAADFRVELNGVPMEQGKGPISIEGPRTKVAPKAPAYAKLSVKNSTNAGAAFTIRVALGPATVASDNASLGAGLAVRSAVLPQSGDCAALTYTNTAAVGRVPKHGTATFCVRFSVPDDAAESLRASAATIILPVSVEQGR